MSDSGVGMVVGEWVHWEIRTGAARKGQSPWPGLPAGPWNPGTPGHWGTHVLERPLVATSQQPPVAPGSPADQTTLPRGARNKRRTKFASQEVHERSNQAGSEGIKCGGASVLDMTVLGVRLQEDPDTPGCPLHAP